MNRILALQGLSEVRIGTVAHGDSNQSNQCSSSTAECSTQSAGCSDTIVKLMAW